MAATSPAALPNLHPHVTLSMHNTAYVENIELPEVTPRTPSQEHKESVPEIQVVVSEPSKSAGQKAKIQFFTLCWTLFLIGWSDSSTGPLLPRIQSVYHVPSQFSFWLDLA